MLVAELRIKIKILIRNLQCDEFYIDDLTYKLYAYNSNDDTTHMENGLHRPRCVNPFETSRISKERYTLLFLLRICIK